MPIAPKQAKRFDQLVGSLRRDAHQFVIDALQGKSVRPRLITDDPRFKEAYKLMEQAAKEAGHQVDDTPAP